MDGRQQEYGAFKTPTEAQKHRDYCIQNDWNPKCKKPVRRKQRYVYYNKQRKKYVVRRKINGKSHVYGSFDTEEEAMAHRDYCIKNGWSMDCKLNHMGDNTPDNKIARMFNLNRIGG